MAAVAALAISAGVAAYGSYQASQASKKAAAEQKAAADRALALQQQQYASSQQALDPYRQAGLSGLQLLQSQSMPTLELPTFSYGEFKAPTQAEAAAEPGIRMAQDEQRRAIEQSASARGTALGGNTLQTFQDRAVGLASQQYGDVYARAQNAYSTNAQQAWNAYQSRYNKAVGEYGAAQLPWQRATELASLGYGATTAGNNLGQNYATNAGNMLLNAGNVTAAGIIGSNNAANQGLYDVGNAAAGIAYAKLPQYQRQPAVAPTVQPTPAGAAQLYGPQPNLNTPPPYGSQVANPARPVYDPNDVESFYRSPYATNPYGSLFR